MDEASDEGLTPSRLGPEERALVSLLVGGHTLLEAARCLDLTPTRARVMLHRLEFLAGGAGRSALLALAAALGVDPVPPSETCRPS